MFVVKIVKSKLEAGVDFMKRKKRRNGNAKTEPGLLPDDPDYLRERLKSLLLKTDNHYCADCLQRGPMWASLTFGVFLCFECSDFHRNLGGMNVCHQVSLIKSVNLDDWTVKQVEFMEEKGNNKSNKYYEATLPPNFCRPSHTNSKEFHKFLYEKYVLLRYIQVEDAALPISNIAAGNLQDISEEQYKCERDGGEDDHELDKFIEKIGENRKVAPKVIIGPVYQQKELEKQSILMKQQFINEDKRKEEQLYRSISAMHNISQRKKQLNHSHSEKMKPIKQEESKRQEELKLLQKEEKFQKYQQVEERRNSKRNEMKRRKFFLFYGNSSYAAARIHSFHDPNENNSCYPPLPKKSLLYKLDKKGLKYSIRDDE